MKTLALAACAAGAMTMASCGDDDVDPLPTDPCDNNVAPTVPIENTDMSMVGGRVEFDDEDQYGSLFELTLEADDPNGNLRFLRVSQNGTFVGGSGDVQVDFDGTVAPLNRDAILIGDDRSDFSKTVRIRVPQENDSTAYAFIVSDTCGLSDTAMVTLVTSEAATPLATTLRDRTFSNQSGPNPGAIDLDTGNAVPSRGNEESELQDLGNGSDGNWLRQVQAENDAFLRVIPASTANPDSTATVFREVDSAEDIRRLYNSAGSDITTTGALTGNTLVIVRRDLDGDDEDDDADDRYYLVNFKVVNNTASDNRDSYTVDIKRTNN